MYILYIYFMYYDLWSELSDNRMYDTFKNYSERRYPSGFIHYGDVIMSLIASQITSLRIVYSTVYSDADQRNGITGDPTQEASNS